MRRRREREGEQEDEEEEEEEVERNEAPIILQGHLPAAVLRDTSSRVSYYSNQKDSVGHFRMR